MVQADLVVDGIATSVQLPEGRRPVILAIDALPVGDDGYPWNGKR